MKQHLRRTNALESLHLGLALVVGSVIASFQFGMSVMLAFLSVSFLSSASWLTHHFIESRMSRERTPFAFDPSSGVPLMAILFTPGILFAFALGTPFALLAVISIGTMLLYSFYLKQMPFAGMCLKSVAFATMPLFGASLQGTVPLLVWVFSLSVFATLFAYFIFQDIEESEERRTILSLLGSEHARAVANAALGVGLLLLLIPYKVANVGTFYTAGLLPAAGLGLYSLLESDSFLAQKYVSYTAYFIGLAFLLDAIF